MKLFNELEAQHGLPRGLLNAVMQQESGGNIRAVSPKGARGAFQFMPATAKQYGVDVNDLNSSAAGAAKMYADLLKQNNGDLNKALAGYNWGQGNVQRNGMERMPAETRQYIQKVTANMQPQANYFDKYDTVEAEPNYFDKYDAPQKPAKAVQKTDAPQKGKGTFSGESLLRGLYDPFTGLAQGAYNLMPKPVQQAGNKLNDFLADKTGLLPKIGPDFNKAISQNEADYRQRQGGGIDAGRIAGNVLSSINAAIALKAPQAAGLAQRVAQGAGIGAMQGMMQPVIQGDYLTEKAKQGAMGAVAGGVLPVVAGGAARIVSPRASVNPDIALLRSKGINPTIGQTLGGIANTTEQKATSMFGFGDSIRTAREGARNQFNKAVLNDAVESVGGKVDDIGTAGVKRAGDIISGAYDDALKGLKGVTLDQTGKAQLASLKSMSANMPDTTRKQFSRIIDNIVMRRMSPKQGMTAETFKLVESELGSRAAVYGKSMQASERELGDALLEAQGILREQAARQNPVYADGLAKANQAYAKLVRAEGAAKSSVVNDGVFTPGQYLGAIKSASKSVRKRDFSRGTALGQELGAAGQRVLGNTYPDSGTAGRMMPLLQGAAGFANPALAIGGTAAGMAAYTPAIQNALVNSVSKRGASAPFTAEQIRKLAPLLNPLVVGLLNGGP